MKTEVTCISCKHWCFYSGEADYSDQTPGIKWYSYCLKGHWSLDGFDVNTEQYREKLLMAIDCKDIKYRGTK